MQMEKRKRESKLTKKNEFTLGQAMGLFLEAKQAERLSPRTIRVYNDHFRYLESWLKKNHHHATLSMVTASVLREYVNWMTYEKSRSDNLLLKRRIRVFDGLSPWTVNMRIK